MPNKRQQEKDIKLLAKRLKMSNKKLWDKLSDRKRGAIIDKYYNLTDIENRGIQNVLSDIKQNRISFGSLFIGLMLGVIGSIIASILLKYIPQDSWKLNTILILSFVILCIRMYKSIDEITAEDFNEYKILEHLSKLVKNDEGKHLLNLAV